MCDCGWLSAPFLGFARLKQIGELFDGENTLLLILGITEAAARKRGERALKRLAELKKNVRQGT